MAKATSTAGHRDRADDSLRAQERLDAGDVRQGAENEAVGFGIPNEQVAFQEHGTFWVSNLVSLAVRQTHLERS